MKKHKKCHHTKSLDELIIKDILSYPQAMCGVDKVSESDIEMFSIASIFQAKLLKYINYYNDIFGKTA